jgi:hypothetical protein
MDVRRKHLQPTLFVDAVPELAETRAPRGQPEDTGAARSAVGKPLCDGDDAEPLDVAARARPGA